MSRERRNGQLASFLKKRIMGTNKFKRNQKGLLKIPETLHLEKERLVNFEVTLAGYKQFELRSYEFASNTSILATESRNINSKGDLDGCECRRRRRRIR